MKTSSSICQIFIRFGQDCQGERTGRERVVNRKEYMLKDTVSPLSESDFLSGAPTGNTLEPRFNPSLGHGSLALALGWRFIRLLLPSDFTLRKKIWHNWRARPSQSSHSLS